MSYQYIIMLIMCIKPSFVCESNWFHCVRLILHVLCGTASAVQSSVTKLRKKSSRFTEGDEEERRRTGRTQERR